MNIKARRSRVEQQGENMRVRRNEEYHGKVQQGEVEEPLGKE